MVPYLQESDIIPLYDKENSEDFVTGEYKGVTINLFETNLEERRYDSRNREYYATIFKGIMVDLTINKKFHGKTIIHSDSGTIGNWIEGRTSILETVRLEDPTFEKKFEVYSSDQIEARYLLTTAFMERLLQLSESFYNSKIECSFYNNNLLIIIPCKHNFFEPGSIFKSEDFVDDIKNLFRDMNLIFEIIDTLKLHQKIGM